MGEETGPGEPGRRPEDLERSERSMVTVRWFAAAFTLLQVLAYEDRPYPENVPVFVLALIATTLLVAGNATITIALPRVAPASVRRVALAGLLLDGGVAMTFVWLWAFDPASALWAILFIIPLEGALKFQLTGAVATWGVVATLYTAREFWGSALYPYFELQWNSITFRMGIGLLIALVAGFMARNLTRQRALVEETLTELRRVDRIRSSLVSTLAHDVRSPIGAIRGAIATVLRKGEAVGSEVRNELLEGADRQAGRLERLAADLLDLARLERGRLELTIGDVPLRETIERSVSYLDGGGAYAIEVDPELIVRADPGRLEQVIVNLASNSLRYGSAPFAIRAAASDGVVTIDVVDHGPGVPPEERAALFEPFRAEEAEGSVGFGLAIVKALSEAHGGGASYVEDPGGGACFRVTLPLDGA